MTRTKRAAALVLTIALLLAALAVTPRAEARRNSCITNPPPNCEFDPVCTENCAVLYPGPSNAEARCECMLGCCRPID